MNTASLHKRQAEALAKALRTALRVNEFETSRTGRAHLGPAEKLLARLIQGRREGTLPQLSERDAKTCAAVLGTAHWEKIRAMPEKAPRLPMAAVYGQAAGRRARRPALGREAGREAGRGAAD